MDEDHYGFKSKARGLGMEVRSGRFISEEDMQSERERWFQTCMHEVKNLEEAASQRISSQLSQATDRLQRDISEALTQQVTLLLQAVPAASAWSMIPPAAEADRSMSLGSVGPELIAVSPQRMYADEYSVRLEAVEAAVEELRVRFSGIHNKLANIHQAQLSEIALLRDAAGPEASTGSAEDIAAMGAATAQADAAAAAAIEVADRLRTRMEVCEAKMEAFDAQSQAGASLLEELRGLLICMAPKEASTGSAKDIAAMADTTAEADAAAAAAIEVSDRLRTRMEFFEAKMEAFDAQAQAGASQLEELRGLVMCMAPTTVSAERSAERKVAASNGGLVKQQTEHTRVSASIIRNRGEISVIAELMPIQVDTAFPSPGEVTDQPLQQQPGPQSQQQAAQGSATVPILRSSGSNRAFSPKRSATGPVASAIGATGAVFRSGFPPSMSAVVVPSTSITSCTTPILALAAPALSGRSSGQHPVVVRRASSTSALVSQSPPAPGFWQMPVASPAFPGRPCQASPAAFARGASISAMSPQSPQASASGASVVASARAA